MIYDLLAPFYDSVNSEINYSDWADFIEEIIAREYRGDERAELVLDLGCGTGKMTFELARRGYDMTGVDYSYDMLDIARNESERLGFGDKILWLCQNMCDFELYGTVDVTVSCLDCVNHLTDKKSLDKCFDLVHNYLVPGGLFVFDINGKHKFENVYADNSFVIEEDGYMCIWQNDYNSRRGICDFYITVFREDEDGKYCRYDEMQSEKMYTLKSIAESLKKSGFELIGAYSDYSFNAAADNDDRIYIAARCIK